MNAIHSTPAMPRKFRTRSKYSQNFRTRNYFYRIFDNIGKELTEANKRDGMPQTSVRSWAWQDKAQA